MGRRQALGDHRLDLERMAGAGFKDLTRRDLSGGIVNLYTGRRDE